MQRLLRKGSFRRPVLRLKSASFPKLYSTNPDAEAGTQEKVLKPLPPLTHKAGSMLHHIYNIQQQFPGAVVMTQVGSFMELYFEQAVKFGELLNLKVARKQQRSPVNGMKSVFMAGFPLGRKEKYERILVKDHGMTVVTLMQDSKYVISGGSEEEKRPISRILTPGTLLEEDLVDQKANNYLALATSTSDRACLMWVDIASGSVKYQILRREELGNALARITPMEVLLDRASTHKIFVAETIGEYAPSATVSPFTIPPVQLWTAHADQAERFSFDRLETDVKRAYVGILSYIDTCMPNSPIKIQEPEMFKTDAVMQLDSRARAALEISATSTGSVKGSLLSTIRRTVTPSGSRLFQEWIASPLQNPEDIRRRQDKVQFLLEQSKETIIRLKQYLSEMPDGSRTLQKLWLPKVNPLNLVLFAKSLQTLDKTASVLLDIKDLPTEWRSPLSSLLAEPLATANQILEMIDLEAVMPKRDEDLESSEGLFDTEDAVPEKVSSPSVDESLTKSRRTKPKSSTSYTFEPATSRDYRPVLIPDACPKVKELYLRQSELASKEPAIIERLRSAHGPSAELRWSPSHLFHVAIVLNGSNDPAPHLKLAQTKRTAYISDAEWAALGNERLGISTKLRVEEERILDELRQTILSQHLSSMRKLYNLLDEIDVQLSFAALAVERRLARPQVIEDSSVFEIEEGRHITVEAGLALGGLSSSGFVSNDCNLSSPQPVCMITGPNMGGKSTFIRQSAIIALLAHVGSFVPAKSARIGIVDRIFCRIGAGDDLYSGRSTFMVEMLETAAILNHATSRSLAIIDEVGRGTSGRDGLAIAYACIKHLVARTKCRTLFATHYGGELWDLLRKHVNSTNEKEAQSALDGLRFLQASLRVANDGEPIFDYKLKSGITSNSCGLLIAELAGFPEIALNDAKSLAVSA